MKRKTVVFFIINIFFIFILGCAKEEKKVITVGAEISLKGALNQIVEQFQESNKNIIVNIEFDASKLLRKQALNGTNLDLLLLSSKEDMNELKKEKVISESKEILENSIIIAGRKKIDKLEEIKGYRVAIGDPEYSPAGVYSLEILKKLNLFEDMKPNIILTRDVRSAMQYVDLYEVDYAFIYKTESKVMKNAQIVYEVSNELHTPIIYSCGILSGKEREETREFYKFLGNGNSREIFLKYGFKVLDSRNKINVEKIKSKEEKK